MQKPLFVILLALFLIGFLSKLLIPEPVVTTTDARSISPTLIDTTEYYKVWYGKDFCKCAVCDTLRYNSSGEVLIISKGDTQTIKHPYQIEIHEKHK